MTSSLSDSIKAFSNRYLIEQYYKHLDQYIEEAKQLMEEEINRRGIGKKEIDDIMAQSEDGADDAPETVHYDKKEFTQLEGGFSTNDSLLVRSMLNEHKIPHFMDASATLLPFTGEELDAHLVTFHIHKDFMGPALAAIAEHYDKNGARYTLKYTDITERLKSFNFSEIPHALIESTEIVEVDFSKEEKDLIISFGRRLLKEVDDIEAKQERVVFYYDSLEDLLERLGGAKAPNLKHTDLLASLELLQIYCNEPDFPAVGAGIAEALMGFFSFTQGA
jgi:hypothetical protein